MARFIFARGLKDGTVVKAQALAGHRTRLIIRLSTDLTQITEGETDRVYESITMFVSQYRGEKNDLVEALRDLQKLLGHDAVMSLVFNAAKIPKNAKGVSVVVSRDGTVKKKVAKKTKGTTVAMSQDVAVKKKAQKVKSPKLEYIGYVPGWDNELPFVSRKEAKRHGAVNIRKISEVIGKKSAKKAPKKRVAGSGLVSVRKGK